MNSPLTRSLRLALRYTVVSNPTVHRDAALHSAHHDCHLPPDPLPRLSPAVTPPPNQARLDTDGTVVTDLAPSAEATLSLRLRRPAVAALVAAGTPHADVLLCWLGGSGGGPSWYRTVATRVHIDSHTLARAALAPATAVLATPPPLPGLSTVAGLAATAALAASPFADREASFRLMLDSAAARHGLHDAIAAALGPLFPAPPPPDQPPHRIGAPPPNSGELCTADGAVRVRVTGGARVCGALGSTPTGVEVELRLRSPLGTGDSVLPLAAASLAAHLPQIALSGASAPRMLALRRAVMALAAEVARTLALAERPHATPPAQAARSVALWQRETDEEMVQLYAILGLG